MSAPAAGPGAPTPEGTEGATERYERRAAAFYRETGMMAPGKDDPLGHHSYEERAGRWIAWLAAPRAGGAGETCACGHVHAAGLCPRCACGGYRPAPPHA